MVDTFLGIDVGSTTVKVVVLDSQGRVLNWRYQRSQGQPRQALLALLSAVGQESDLRTVLGVGVTGSGGEVMGGLIGGRHVNELVAQTRAIGELHPEARTVIEIGGQDSKFLSVAWDPATRSMVLVDFAMNALCAAGTGSFLDQQAERLGISIETDFAALALQAQSPARIAGRCTVFAKSDMIHLQQQGTPLPDILAGLCLALARNFKSVIGRGKLFRAPILFQGGVACNAGVVRAFETVLDLEPGQLIIPGYHLVMAALGTGLLAIAEREAGTLPAWHGLEPLTEAIRGSGQEHKSMPPLGACSPVTPADAPESPVCPSRASAFVGVDVGSVSTNVVLIDEGGRLLAQRYLPTAGQPLEAVRRALTEIGQEVGERVMVRGVGVTGSGRYLTADFVGADIVRNEITAQARSAIAVDPYVDTIFEIGGQDSKYIRLDHGAVIDFAMNNACAAGTGSFLEEQATRLNIDLTLDFSRLAVAAEHPTCLGERCTVFMESDLVHHQQRGARLDDLTGGLAYAIAENYLNRVVNGRPLGHNIFFQGGVAWNQSVRAAFEQLTGRGITVPRNHDVMGAIGVALLAQEEMVERLATQNQAESCFKGFNLAGRCYESSVYECQACPNLCEINKIAIAGEPPIFYGARCDRFEEAGRKRHLGTDLPDLFAERNELLVGGYVEPGERGPKKRVGIPRALAYYDLFPYWRTMFEHLGLEVVLSSPTSPRTAAKTAEGAPVETCFPAKLLFGHVVELLAEDVDYVFMPSLVNREDSLTGQPESNYCTFIPAMPHLVTAHLPFGPEAPRVLQPQLHMQWPAVLRQELRQLASTLGVADRRMAQAQLMAEAAQHRFYAQMRARGQEILAGLGPDKLAAVLVGRPYNTADAGVCQDLPAKLRKLGVLAIPLDFLALDDVNITSKHEAMFWRSGQKILAAAQIIREDPRLQAVYVTNFSCGPDSFLISFFRRLLGSKPFLELEFDDHTGDAGIVTRCEAFFESLRLQRTLVR